MSEVTGRCCFSLGEPGDNSDQSPLCLAPSCRQVQQSACGHAEDWWRPCPRVGVRIRRCGQGFSSGSVAEQNVDIPVPGALGWLVGGGLRGFSRHRVQPRFAAHVRLLYGRDSAEHRWWSQLPFIAQVLDVPVVVQRQHSPVVQQVRVPTVQSVHVHVVLPQGQFLG